MFFLFDCVPSLQEGPVIVPWGMSIHLGKIEGNEGMSKNCVAKTCESQSTFSTASHSPKPKLESICAGGQDYLQKQWTQLLSLSK